MFMLLNTNNYYIAKLLFKNIITIQVASLAIQFLENLFKGGGSLMNKQELFNKVSVLTRKYVKYSNQLSNIERKVGKLYTGNTLTRKCYEENIKSCECYFLKIKHNIKGLNNQEIDRLRNNANKIRHKLKITEKEIANLIANNPDAAIKIKNREKDIQIIFGEESTSELEHGHFVKRRSNKDPYFRKIGEPHGRQNYLS